VSKEHGDLMAMREVKQDGEEFFTPAPVRVRVVQGGGPAVAFMHFGEQLYVVQRDEMLEALNKEPELDDEGTDGDDD
jgi:hypothetical protein